MYTPANNYAIGPVTHNWERENWEMQEISRDKREEACKADFNCWERFAYCDRNKESGKKDIEEKMESALDLAFDTEKDAKKFRNALFLAYCSNDHIEELRKVIGEVLFKSYAINWQED